MNHTTEIDCLLLSRNIALSANPDQARVLEQRAIERMIFLYSTELFRLEHAILRDPDEAEDALQKTFIRAANSFNHYQPGTNFKAWLFTIAINICRGVLRKQKIREAFVSLIKSEQHNPYPILNPEEIILLKESDKSLWSAVELLDDKHRLVVLLRYQQGLLVPDISRILSIPEKTVYTRLYNAFRKLKGLLAEDQEDELTDSQTETVQRKSSNKEIATR
jgi:RNA polymerase sigma-70 factor (ECF subfamily)